MCVGLYQCVHMWISMRVCVSPVVPCLYNFTLPAKLCICKVYFTHKHTGRANIYCSVCILMNYPAQRPGVSSGKCLLLPTLAQANTKERHRGTEKKKTTLVHSWVDMEWASKVFMGIHGHRATVPHRLLLVSFVIICIFLTIDVAFFSHKRKIVTYFLHQILPVTILFVVFFFLLHWNIYHESRIGG